MKRAVVAAIACASLLLSASPAAALVHSVQTWGSGGHLLVGRATANNSGHLESWSAFRLYESVPGWIDTVCNYQGYLNENYPDLGTVFYQYSSYRSGCTLSFGFFDFPNWDGVYRSDVYIGAWWRSEDCACNGWREIGVLRH